MRGRVGGVCGGRGRRGEEGRAFLGADVGGGDPGQANAAMRARHAAKTPAEARAFLIETHDLLLAHLAGLDEVALSLPFRTLGPNEPADRVIPAVSHIVYESTAGHYHEHLGWLRSYTF